MALTDVPLRSHNGKFSVDWYASSNPAYSVKNEIFTARLYVTYVGNGSQNADLTVLMKDSSAPQFEGVSATVSARELNTALNNNSVTVDNGKLYLEGIWTFRKIGSYVRLIRAET